MKSINKLLAIFLLSTIISTLYSSSGFAQDEAENTKVELNKISCRELLKMPGKDRELTLVFFHGLIASRNNQMVIDRVALREATNKITDYCINNPNSMLMTAFAEYL